MQPDLPHLCRFWLHALIASLSDTDELAVFLPCLLIGGFIWKYTWAAVPEYLRVPLITSLRPLIGRLARAAHRSGSRDEAVKQRERFARNYMYMCAAQCTADKHNSPGLDA